MKEKKKKNLTPQHKQSCYSTENSLGEYWYDILRQTNIYNGFGGRRADTHISHPRGARGKFQISAYDQDFQGKDTNRHTKSFKTIEKSEIQ